VEASAFFRWRCGVCGGPVVPEGTKALASLVRAHRARAMAVGWFAAAGVFACIATLSAGLAMVLWSSTHAAAIVLASVAAVSAVLANAGRVKGQRRNAEARRELEVAWGDPPPSPGDAALLSRQGART
jgi:MFS family permease